MITTEPYAVRKQHGPNFESFNQAPSVCRPEPTTDGNGKHLGNHGCAAHYLPCRSVSLPVWGREAIRWISWLFRFVMLSSTLHCRGKNGRSKKIGQTNQTMIHFVPNMYASGKISALQPGTQTMIIFGTTKKIENYLKTFAIELGSQDLDHGS